MRSALATYDDSRVMDEQSWWDLWNISYRGQDQLDVVSSELFSRTVAIINGITEKESSRVLEVGCGTGTLSRMFTFSSYLGLDFSPAAVEIARERSWHSDRNIFNHPAKYEVADFCEWNAPADPFDVVICVDAIACIREQSLVMAKMARCLRSGGRLVMTTVNRFVYDRIRRSSSVKLQNGPVSHWLTSRELRQLVTQSGLTVERFETIMPRGNVGILRLVNSHRLNHAFGSRAADGLRSLKELIGLGQYLVVVARKE